MPSRAPSRAFRRRALREDIPIARRRPQAFAGREARPLARLLPIAALVAAGTAALVIGPLRPWLLPPPVPGLQARPSPDGRLLGHFPYAEAPASDLVEIAPGLQLRTEAAEAFSRLLRAAEADGIALTVISAFRSRAVQKQLFFGIGAERRQSASLRARVSAPPGYSEHSTGYAVDLGDGQRPDTNLSERFETTSAYAWLAANAARFHFALSFPRGNRQGVSYEPWHWRYEGSTEALRVFDPAHRLQR